MKKVCTCCKDEKDIALFNFRNKAKDIRHSYCAECGKIKTKKHYLDNKQVYIDKARKHTKANKEFIREQKDVPCADCKTKYPYYVMDFDHLGEKDFNISENTGKRGINILKKEIKKCDVVCANCHRIRTHKRNMLG